MGQALDETLQDMAVMDSITNELFQLYHETRGINESNASIRQTLLAKIDSLKHQLNANM